MALNVFNTLKGEKEGFAPLQTGKVGMYVCGITPYDYCHLGHGRCYTAFDTIRRYLLHLGFEVKFVQNFTDIDDKIIRRASEQKKDPLELSAFFSEEYFKEADALGIMRAGVYPKVTQHIPEIISLVEKLVAKGFAYAAGDGVYFDVAKFPGYGKLSRQPLEKLVAGARVAPGDFKHSPADFAIWKNAKEGEPFWESPWGRGRPGWHIECSAMSSKYLGETFDIHGGGQDLVFPHHEDEIAQSEAANGKPFVKYWLHNGFIIVGKDKMAKSLGNFVTLRQAIEKHGGQVLRFFYLQSHYREPVDAGEEKIAKAAESLQKLLDAIALLEDAAKKGGAAECKEISAIEAKFNAAMDDDFNTPLAISAVFELKDLAHKSLAGNSEVPPSAVLGSMKKLLGVLGVLDAKPKEAGISQGEIETAIAQREDAKKAKDFGKADGIRKMLAEKGVLLEDSAGGAVRWKRKA
ncbi:MAG: cysteine--tRNA ligase [Candidatus Micrarchaeia archaeon]|jgi:cysteinyl-tRNA synthetase